MRKFATGLKSGRPSVFIGTVEIAGNYSSLAEGLESLGFHVSLVLSQVHPFGYGKSELIPSATDHFLRPKRFIGRLALPDSLKIMLLVPFLFAEIISNVVISLFWAIKMIQTHDVFIFGFGSSLLHGNIDMMILRMMKSKIVISNIGHGSEARPPAVDGAWPKEYDDFLSARDLRKLTVQNRRRVRRHERFADVLVGDPMSSSPFASRKMVNSYVIGRPMLLSKYEEIQSGAYSSSKKCPKIIHAPSHAPGKGTAKIESIIYKLKSEGFCFTYTRIEGVTNSEVLEILGSADLVIDQLYSDRYWSKTGAEAAALGRPTLVGGYAFSILENIVPPDLRPPVVWCHPDDFEQRLRNLLRDPDELPRLGAQARKFLRETYSSTQVAKRWEVLFRPESIPPDWFFDPMEIHYVGGVGQSMEKSLRNHQFMVSRFGLKSLGFSHNKPLQRAFEDHFLERDS